METGIGPTVDRILNTIVQRLSSDSFRQKISDELVDPLTEKVQQRVRPYVYGALLLYAILVILLLVIIYLLLTKGNAKMHT